LSFKHWKNSIGHIYIKTAINYFLQMFRTLSTEISPRKNLAEHWDLPNTGIFYSKDVTSGNEKWQQDDCRKGARGI
jgi:hypothetical protein